MLEVDVKDFDRYFSVEESTNGQPLPAPKASSSIHDDNIFQLLGEHVRKGGLVGFCFHAGNPFTGGDVGSGTVKQNGALNLAELADPANPATAAAQSWRRSLDHVAAIVQRLATESAPAQPVVLFRPFHECNGSWFWWGQRGHAAYRAAWQGAFSYLTGTKGLHNLLWVYSAAHDVDKTTLSGVTHHYPGPDLVDIVGLDIYHDDLSAKGAYVPLTQLGKPFGITEYGPDQDQDHTGAWLPNNEVRDVIKSQYPQTVLAICWYTPTDRVTRAKTDKNWQISDKADPASLLQDPWAITVPG